MSVKIKDLCVLIKKEMRVVLKQYSEISFTAQNEEISIYHTEPRDAGKQGLSLKWKPT